MSVNQVFIGYDRAEDDAALVAEHSLHKFSSCDVSVKLLNIKSLRQGGLYTRSSWTDRRQRYDTIDERPFSTEFSFTRFLVPALMQYEGWALFVDSDVMFRADVDELFDNYTVDNTKALMCVQHEYHPVEGVKMRSEVGQFPYRRKNWSSVMLFNCSHPANWFLTPQLVNTSEGRDLQQLFWLRDHEIGHLPQEWNFLDGQNMPVKEPKIVHFTRGTPDLPAYSNVPYAGEWRDHFSEVEYAA